MKKYLITASLILTANVLLAQQIDEQKMNKDLKVAHTVLRSLAFENKKVLWHGDTDLEQAQYIQGFGAILTLPAANSHFYNFKVEIPPMPPLPDFSEAIVKGMQAVEKLEYIIEEEEEEVYTEQRKAEIEQRREELQQRQKELEQRAQTIVANVNTRILNTDSLREVKQAETVKQIKSFLLDYGHLISQLKDDEKILVLEKSPRARFYHGSEGMETLKRGNLSVETTMKDIRAFQAGEIGLEEAESRIEVNLGEKEKALPKDLALFQSIMHRLYKPDLSETYYLESRLPYEHIDGLGTIFYMDVVSSLQTGNKRWKVPTQNKDNLNQEERDSLIKSLYPEFEANLKSNILEYGKNISSLEDDEQLIFKIGMTRCIGCQIPKTMEIQIDGATLKKLKSGKITEEEALQQLKMSRGEMQ